MSSKENNTEYAGQSVVVMGLGLHGGGLESARYLALHAAKVTVTDLRDAETLAPSISKLEGLPIRYVLGHHDIEDFKSSDFIVKNPAVKVDSPYLAAARRVETDISIFLSNCPARLIAVTGSKGKSSVSSAIYWGLQNHAKLHPGTGKAYLGGNITISPLSFLDQLEAADTVVLELSSWQLGDLRGRRTADGKQALLKPRIAVLTAIMSDHQDRYGNMEEYVADKRVIYQGQEKEDLTIVGEDAWGRSFAEESRARKLVYSATQQGPGNREDLVPEKVLTPGLHQRQNLLCAALALRDLGFDLKEIRESMASFPGIEHRLEFFHEAKELRFYNDTAATIPEAAAAAIRAFERPPIIVCGGTDKALDFSPLIQASSEAKALILLAGTASLKIKALLEARGIAYEGPFDELDAAVKKAGQLASSGDIIVLSPGCASFGMFINEFDRGAKWKEAVRRLFPR
ncbi:UDP-N-acetylmuramoyl-L-alanine--D-glutamate ligase [Treponema sp.]